MATNTFKNGLGKNIGLTPVTIYTSLSSKSSICIELDLCNTTGSPVKASAYVTSGGVDYYVVKNVLIPTESTAQVIAGQKIVLTNGDTLKIVSNTASSIDAVAAILEDVG